MNRIFVFRNRFVLFAIVFTKFIHVSHNQINASEQESEYCNGMESM